MTESNLFPHVNNVPLLTTPTFQQTNKTNNQDNGKNIYHIQRMTTSKVLTGTKSVTNQYGYQYEATQNELQRLINA